jgi:RNA polymerase sigma factor (sigma-70 family)
MRSYSIQNYIRYKEDLTRAVKAIPHKPWNEYSRRELIVKFLPLVENLARKFPSGQQASGIMNIMDFIQEGSFGLIRAVDKIDWPMLMSSEDKEKTLKSFLAKRIRGAIRRGIDSNRGTMRIPEHKLNEIRRDFGKDRKAVEMFFNSIFLSIDVPSDETDMVYDIPDKKEPFNYTLLNIFLKNILITHLTPKEYQVLRLSYGLDCDKRSAKQIAEILDIKGESSYVRVSQLKRQAVDKLMDNVDYSQVLEFL